MSLDRRIMVPLAVATAVIAAPTILWAAPGAATVAGGVAPVLLALLVILLAAKVGGDVATRFNQPAVLGELIAGVLLGNVVWLGIGWFDPIRTNPTIEILAEIGVILLLFQIGLESNLVQMVKVGLASTLVATLGVVAPFFLGWGVGVLFFPAASIYTHVFLGATLTATSVGITARVLKDLGRIDSPEARIILGAAVIDDVMGLLILAVVAGIIAGAESGRAMSSGAILWLIGKAVLFLGGAILAGRLVYRPLFHAAAYLRAHGMLLVAALSICFAGAILAAQAGLAPIVGAFAAGLVLEEVQYRDHPTLMQRRLEDLLEPIIILLTPVFFVLMGMRVDLRTFGQMSVLGFAGALTVVAIIGKQAASFGVVRGGEPANRWIVGLGMIPRGEVGLIFAGVGLTLTVAGERIVSPSVYSAVVIMVIVTTLLTPPLLAWAFRRPSGLGTAGRAPTHVLPES